MTTTATALSSSASGAQASRRSVALDAPNLARDSVTPVK